MLLFKNSLPWACIFLLTGCVHYQPQPLAPEKSAAQFDARRLNDLGLRDFVATNAAAEIKNWPPEKWGLNSLTLVAFYFHPNLAVARAQWRVAEAGVKTAGARPNPSLTATPGYDSGIPGNYSPWLIPVSLDVPLETAGKRGKRIAEAEKIAESARWDYVSSAWQIRSNVRANLLDWSQANRRAALLQQQLAIQTDIVKRLQQRLAAGEISRPELTTAQIARHKTQLDLSDAESKCTESRSRLAEALGLSLPALAGVNTSFEFSQAAPAGLTSAEARRAALLSRSDLRAALADYAVADADLRLQIAKQYPDLHLGPGYAWNSGNAGDSQWSLGVTLELPILDHNQGPIAEAKAQRELAAAKFTALQAQVIGEIDRAVSGYRVAAAQMQTSTALLAAEAGQQKSAQAQLQAGEAEPLDFLSAQIEFTTAQLARLDSAAKLQTALGALEDALQRPADSFNALKVLPDK